jgi:hypothetical protein
MIRARLAGWIGLALALVLAGGRLTGADPGLADAKPPGVVIDASPDPAVSFIGSPSLVVLPDGTYVASHDFFGSKSPLLATTTVLASRDRGLTWRLRARLPHQFWSSLFYLRGALYLLGTTREYGDVVIRRSRDGGTTWTEPADAGSGRLLVGRYHCAPTPVIEHGGRIWRAFEHYSGDGSWSGRFFNSLVLSLPVDSDPLIAANWVRSNELLFDAALINADRPGWLEGNVVAAPDGRILNLLRLHELPALTDRFPLEGAAAGIPRYEAAAVIDVSADGRTVSFDPAHGFIHFPGASSKFTIRYDPVSRRYWSLVNKITNPWSGYLPAYSPYNQRNVLMLTSSTDLRNWEERYTVLRWREGRPLNQTDRVGFQYPDWQFDGDDLIAVVRTSWGGHTFHDANYLTFHRLRDFRRLRPTDSPAPLPDTLVAPGG